MMDSIRDPVVLQAKLNEELGHYFVCHTCVQLINGHLWIRLGIYDDIKKGTLPAPVNSTYVVYYPHSTYIFISSLRKENSMYILKGLAVGMECEDVIDPGASLDSNHVQSLADLVLYPTSQGSYRTARLDANSANPLALIHDNKRKALEKIKTEEKKRRIPIREDIELYVEVQQHNY
eukprot:Phypoly_transcript_15013.p1 GENE.Phypoly_transcript_15013~~Phypoly_transcript_15013.p1  ORF type:complete len:177 (+),score=10.42 Phypoly_transcript_15013:188-718(+)